MSRPAIDRGFLGTFVDAVREQDRRRLCGNESEQSHGRPSTYRCRQPAFARKEPFHIPVPVRPDTRYVGIDVSKAKLDVCLSPSGQTACFTNDPAGISPLIQLLKVALIAGMRKLLAILNQMVKNNERWRVPMAQNP